MKTSSAHVIAFLILQIIIIVVFLLFVRYDPAVAQKSKNSVKDGDRQIKDIYPMFQDVHVMIFAGIGFLMTFLKKYGLSAVSLNMICATLTIEVFTLVNGLLHPHCEDPRYEFSSAECESSWPYIDVNLGTMLSADFATATVLISFGVVLGVTSPFQLVVMTVLETVFYVLNDMIGRQYLGAVDVGCTIFIHLFAAYFGLTVARVLYHPDQTSSNKEGSSYSSDMFSMVGTVFLWVYWPSFNASGAATGDAQERALLNTYYSLCSCVISTVVVSCLLNPERKLSMEHIQNATLAGGVVVGATADMMLTPGGAVVVGTLAGLVSTLGFRYVQPFLLKNLKIHDTCGVHNLHGLPGLLGSILSIIIVAIANSDTYDKFSGELPEDEKSMNELFPATPNQQAVSQVLAVLLTLVFACVGGLVTGLAMRVAGKLVNLTEEDMFSDTTNIQDVDQKCEVPEELLGLMEDFKPGSHRTDDESPLIQN